MTGVLTPCRAVNGREMKKVAGVFKSLLGERWVEIGMEI